jgi:hypothetical protein
MPETAQSTPETDEKKSRGVGSYVVWAFVAVMVYVLSSGPACVLVEHSSALSARQQKVIGSCVIIYVPIIWAYYETPFHKLLGFYWYMWCPDRFDAKGEPRPR